MGARNSWEEASYNGAPGLKKRIESKRGGELEEEAAEDQNPCRAPSLYSDTSRPVADMKPTVPPGLTAQCYFMNESQKPAAWPVVYRRHCLLA
jgi:hypothetical protein